MFRVTKNDITSNQKGHEIYFKFSKEPNNIEINNLKLKVNEKQRFLYSSKEEVSHNIIKEKIMIDTIQKNIKSLKEKFKVEIYSELPTAFWERNKHMAKLPYESDFIESKIPLK